MITWRKSDHFSSLSSIHTTIFQLTLQSFFEFNFPFTPLGRVRGLGHVLTLKDCMKLIGDQVQTHFRST
jgi:hypothetical protein